jgi:hypothetical protein
LQDYGGISASRLEVLEERLKDDVIAELKAFGGRYDEVQTYSSDRTYFVLRLLLHTETPDGSVIPVWEEVQSENVFAPKETMAARRFLDNGVELHYARIPITAERVPDFSDFSELMGVVIRTNATNTPIVLNCQLGMGRSTLTSVCVLK